MSKDKKYLEDMTAPSEMTLNGWTLTNAGALLMEQLGLLPDNKLEHKLNAQQKLKGGIHYAQDNRTL